MPTVWMSLKIIPTSNNQLFLPKSSILTVFCKTFYQFRNFVSFGQKVSFEKNRNENEVNEKATQEFFYKWNHNLWKNNSWNEA